MSTTFGLFEDEAVSISISESSGQFELSIYMRSGSRALSIMGPDNLTSRQVVGIGLRMIEVALYQEPKLRSVVMDCMRRADE